MNRGVLRLRVRKQGLGVLDGWDASGWSLLIFLASGQYDARAC